MPCNKSGSQTNVGLELVKGFQVIGGNFADELQPPNKKVKSKGCENSSSLIHA